jgi:hypothetical protein
VIKPETLDFPPLNCSLDATLGDYYQDFSAAIQMVESGYHGGFDERGIPLLDMPGQGSFPNAITTAQYALANMTAARRGEEERNERARVLCDWLVEAQQQDGDWAGCWLMDHDNQKYTWLRAPWTGALASGNAISALLRAEELFGSGKYRAAADAAYAALHRPRPSDHLLFDTDSELWYEEYPGDPPLHVLNGHIYTLFAVTDYARVSGDAQAEERWRRAAATALAHLDDFDIGYWSIYDLRFREPVNRHYQKNIHVPQLRILAALTGEQRFAEYADRWERQLTSLVGRARWAVSLRLRRFRRS